MPKKSRYELYSMITMDYYGFRDEDDGSLLIKDAAFDGKKKQVEVAA